MQTIEATHRCGHVEGLQVTPGTADAIRRAALLGDCRACRLGRVSADAYRLGTNRWAWRAAR